MRDEASTAPAAVNGPHLITSGRKIEAIPSAKYRPMPTPIPASWLRATVAIANPMAVLIVIDSAARPSSSGRPPRAALSDIPDSDTPTKLAPRIAATMPTR